MDENQFNIGNVIDLSGLGEQWHKPEEYEGITLILKAALRKQGRKSAFYLMTCEVEETQQTIVISSGADQVMLVVAAWEQAGSTPVRFSFGRLKSATAPRGYITIITNPASEETPL